MAINQVIDDLQPSAEPQPIDSNKIHNAIAGESRNARIENRRIDRYRGVAPLHCHRQHHHHHYYLIEEILRTKD